MKQKNYFCICFIEGRHKKRIGNVVKGEGRIVKTTSNLSVKLTLLYHSILNLYSYIIECVDIFSICKFNKHLFHNEVDCYVRIDTKLHARAEKLDAL